MNQTSQFDYIEEAHVTCSNSYHGKAIPLEHFAQVVGEAIEALTNLTQSKKPFFTGATLALHRQPTQTKQRLKTPRIGFPTTLKTTTKPLT